MRVSVVIRTLNEERYLDELLRGIASQARGDVEVVVIDSGSTDQTLRIAEGRDCRIVHIEKHEFTFGRSLNMGSAAATGDILVFVSGHCVPRDSSWLSRLIAPIEDRMAHYSYGRQIGRDTTKFSETRLFEKYYPPSSRIPQAGFFCNNANAAIARKTWNAYHFNEDILGLEDMELAKRIVRDGGKIAYVADAAVFHIHDETWSQIRRRYEREAIALQSIMPEVQVSLLDAARFAASGVAGDLWNALTGGRLVRELGSVFGFRAAQYWGTYLGNHEHRRLSRERKERYFYPTKRPGDPN